MSYKLRVASGTHRTMAWGAQVPRTDRLPHTRQGLCHIEFLSLIFPQSGIKSSHLMIMN